MGFVTLVAAGSSGGSGGTTGGDVAGFLVIAAMYAVPPGALLGTFVATLTALVIAFMPVGLRHRVTAAQTTVVVLAALVACLATTVAVTLFSQVGWAAWVMAVTLSSWCVTAVMWRGPLILGKLHNAPQTGV